MTEKIECIVVGAGAVGLACARALARSGRDVIVLESADAIGTGTSSRNSEVIHAGIYYPTGSLKARLCVSGKRMLYDFCAAAGVGHRRYGKLIVATNDTQTESLSGIRQQAEANGVHDLQWIEGPALHKMEPALKATVALLSPSTGVIDSHGLMLAYQGQAEEAGAVIAFKSPVIGGAVEDGGIRLRVGGDEPMDLSCRLLVNSAGLGAQETALCIDGMPPEHVPQRYLAKGNYFTLAGRAPFTHLIYPVPQAAGLGVHLTLDMAGQARFGPDVEWVDEIDYTVDAARAEAFYDVIRQYWPDLEDGALQPGYAGIRPKIQKPGEPAADFLIQGPDVHGVKGLVNLFGIESPGLTASMAIAEEVMEKLEA